MQDGTQDSSRTTAVELTAGEIDELLNAMQAAENEGHGHNETIARKLTAALRSLAELQPPAVWMVRKHPDMRIMDPDGWRDPDGRSFEDHITEEEFDRRYPRCTVGPLMRMRESNADSDQPSGDWKNDHANEAYKVLNHELVRDVMEEFADNMGFELKGLPEYGLRKVAMYAAQVARAQALDIDPDLLRSSPREVEAVQLRTARIFVEAGKLVLRVDDHGVTRMD